MKDHAQQEQRMTKQIERTVEQAEFDKEVRKRLAAIIKDHHSIPE
jgi:hypothetical protein